MKSFIINSKKIFTKSIKNSNRENLSYSKLKIEEKQPIEVILNRKSCSKIDNENIIVIGASTGGVNAIETILKELKKDSAGVLIVQHMPEGFTKSFAQRLNSICKIEVREAKNGDKIEKGLALVCPGNYHMLINYRENSYFVELNSGPKVNRHKPSVDVLFRSVANEVGKNVTAIILTGMGNDGAVGISELKKCGAFTIAQDEESSVIFGMPKEAIKLNCIDKILPLKSIASYLN